MPEYLSYKFEDIPGFIEAFDFSGRNSININLMKTDITTTLTETGKQAIYKLWNQEYPHQLKLDGYNALDDYLNNLHDQSHHFAINEDGQIVGWACVFEREGDKWFAIIVDTIEQNKGTGTALLQLLKAKELRLNGWVTDHNRYIKENGEVYHSPLQFYVKNDFVVCPDVRLETEKLSAVKIKWNAPA